MTDGVLWGIEGVHVWFNPPDAEKGLALNHLKDDDSGEPLFPRYEVEAIGGLMGLGDPEDNADPKVGEDGENGRLSRRRGKTVSYTGLVIARSLRDMRVAEAQLRAAFADQSIEGRMLVMPHPDNVEFEDDPPKHYFARSIALECGDEQGPPVSRSFGYERVFVLGLRMHDPRYFDDDGGVYV